MLHFFVGDPGGVRILSNSSALDVNLPLRKALAGLPSFPNRRIDVLDAVLVSWRVVMANPLPMALWATLIMGLALLGMLGFVMGCAVVIPVLCRTGACWVFTPMTL